VVLLAAEQNHSTTQNNVDSCITLYEKKSKRLNLFYNLFIEIIYDEGLGVKVHDTFH